MGKTIPQTLYTWSPDAIGIEHSWGVGIFIAKGFEFRVTQHFLFDRLGARDRNLGPADLGNNGPWGRYMTVGVHKVFRERALVTCAQRPRGGRPAKALNDPNNQGDKCSEDHEWQKQDGDEPAAPAHRSYIAGDSRLRIAPDAAAKNRGVAGNRDGLIKPHVASKGGDVSGDLRALIENNIAGKGGDVARYLPAHVNAAAKAGKIANFLIGPNIYRVADLREAGIVFREGGGKREAQDRECRKTGGAAEGFHEITSLTMTPELKSSSAYPTPKRDYPIRPKNLLVRASSGSL